MARLRVTDAERSLRHSRVNGPMPGAGTLHLPADQLGENVAAWDRRGVVCPLDPERVTAELELTN